MICTAGIAGFLRDAAILRLAICGFAVSDQLPVAAALLPIISGHCWSADLKLSDSFYINDVTLSGFDNVYLFVSIIMPSLQAFPQHPGILNNTKAQYLLYAKGLKRDTN